MAKNTRQKPTEMGTNRTGAGTSPIDSKKTIEGAEQGVPVASFDTTALHDLKLAYSREAAPLGTMPPPATVKGVAKAAKELLKGQKPVVFLDLLGERLAFERTGTRLYESLLVKLEAGNPHAGGPTREELERIRDEELEHAALLTRCLEKLGADPTAMTPSADTVAVASMGILKIVADPRTTLTEGLKAVQIAELADNDAWLQLADLAERLGHEEMAQDFRTALAEEEDHLARVRAWVIRSLAGQAGLGPDQIDAAVEEITSPT
jgi:rubrerythrin